MLRYGKWVYRYHQDNKTNNPSIFVFAILLNGKRDGGSGGANSLGKQWEEGVGMGEGGVNS